MSVRSFEASSSPRQPACRRRPRAKSLGVWQPRSSFTSVHRRYAVLFRLPPCLSEQLPKFLHGVIASSCGRRLAIPLADMDLVRQVSVSGVFCSFILRQLQFSPPPSSRCPPASSDSGWRPPGAFGSLPCGRCPARPIAGAYPCAGGRLRGGVRVDVMTSASVGRGSCGGQGKARHGRQA